MIETVLSMGFGVLIAFMGAVVLLYLMPVPDMYVPHRLWDGGRFTRGGCRRWDQHGCSDPMQWLPPGAWPFWFLPRP